MLAADSFNLTEMTLRGHPKSLVCTWFDRGLTILEQSTVVTVSLSLIISEIQQLVG